MKTPLLTLLALSAWMAAVPALAGTDRSVRHVIDGERLLLEDGRVVRLAAVTVADARGVDWIRQFAAGQTLRLEFVEGEHDASGNAYVFAYKFLCESCAIEAVEGYVYSQQEGKTYLFINGTAVRSGIARFNPERSFGRSEEFKRYEDEARQHKRGQFNPSLRT